MPGVLGFFQWHFVVEQEGFSEAYRDAKWQVMKLAGQVLKGRKVPPWYGADELSADFWRALWCSPSGRSRVSGSYNPGGCAVAYAKKMLPQIVVGISGYDKRAWRTRDGRRTRQNWRVRGLQERFGRPFSAACEVLSGVSIDDVLAGFSEEDDRVFDEVRDPGWVTEYLAGCICRRALRSLGSFGLSRLPRGHGSEIRYSIDGVRRLCFS